MVVEIKDPLDIAQIPSRIARIKAEHPADPTDPLDLIYRCSRARYSSMEVRQLESHGVRVIVEMGQLPRVSKEVDRW